MDVLSCYGLYQYMGFVLSQGGDTLSITLSLDQLLQSSATSSTASLPPSAEDAKYFVVFEGSRRRHVVSARPVQGSGRPLVHAEDIVTGHVAMEDAETKDSYIHLQTVIPGKISCLAFLYHDPSSFDHLINLYASVLPDLARLPRGCCRSSCAKLLKLPLRHRHITWHESF